MNRPLPLTKDFYKTRLLAIAIFFAVLSGTFVDVIAQDIAISAASGGVAPTPLSGGVTNVAVLGVQLTKAGGGGRTVTGLTFPMTSDPNGKFLNPRLYESADATFSGVDTETLIAGGVIGTLNVGDISFSGGTITDFDGASGGDNEFIFLVVDVVSGATGTTAAIVPSLASTGVTTAATVTGGPVTGTSYLFTAPVTTIANLSTGLAASPLLAGLTGQGVFGFSLTSTGTQTVSVINVQVSSTAVSKWGSYSLITSTDNSFATTGDNSVPIGGLSFDASSGTMIAITGLNESINTTTKNYFLVVDVNTAVIGSTTAVLPSLALADVTATPGTVAGSASGTNYSFTAPEITIANLSTGLAASPLNAGATGQGVFGFSLTSTGTQTVTVLNIQTSSTPIGKWGTYSLITSTDNSFATTGDNSVAIGGLTFTPSATQIAITDLSQIITTSATNYFLVVNVDPGAAGSITPSLAAANATATTGTFTGTAAGTAYSIAPILTIANLSTGLAASPLVAATTDQGVFGFSLTSNGAQTVTVINVQLTSTPASKWSNYRLITSTDASYATAGDNSVPIGGLTFTPSASQVAITGLNQAITTGTNYFLVVDVDPAVTGATTAVQPSLAGGNITITTGGGTKTGTATGTNYNFGVATATFAQLTTGIAASPLSAGVANQAVIGFSATSNATQNFTVLNVQVSSTPVSKWGSYSLVRSTDASFATAGDNTTIGSLTFTPTATQIGITGLNETLNSTAKNYFLVVTVDPAVTGTTPAIQPSFAQADITATGNVVVTGTTITGTSYLFNTSQLSDIITNGSTTASIAYEDSQDDPISGFPDGSTNLGDYIIRDGGASSDGDNKGTTVTSIVLQVTNSENLRKIVLYDDSDDSEIPGTQQAVSGPGTINVTFTPSTPISVPDGGTFEFKVRASFQEEVTDNHAIQVSVFSVTAATTGSGFSPVGTWASTQTASNTNVIAVVASKFIMDFNLTTQAIGQPFTITVQAVDDVFENIDLDYNGKIDLTRSPGGGAFTAAQSFTGRSLTAGEVTWTNAIFSVSNNYTITANDNAYDPPAPENQVNLENGSKSIVITASSCTITQATDPVLCYGASSSYEVLSNIVIEETDNAGIAGSNGTYTFSLALPSGFVFDQSVTTGVSVGGGGDLTAPSGYTYPGANIVQFSFNLNGTANQNTITISGLRVQHPHPGTVSPDPTPLVGALNITRLGGTANIAGVGAGAILGTISAAQNNPAVSFTVTATVGNIDPNTTSYNVSSPPVNLIGTGTPVGVFSGSGVTPGPFRFNPNTLGQGNYDITYLQTSANGCQSVAVETFTVFDSGIGGLNSSYCSNSDPSSDFTVSGTFINNLFGAGWSLDHYTYYDPTVYSFYLPLVANATVGATYTNNGQTFTVVQTITTTGTDPSGRQLICTGTGAPLTSGTLIKSSGTGDALITFSSYDNYGNFRPITSPSNIRFDPGLDAYQTIYQYFGGEIPIGFAVCNGGSVPCNGSSNYGTFSTYQWVRVNPAPTVSFTLPSDVYAYCEDNAPIILSGSPANGIEVADDNFTAGAQAISISSEMVGSDRVWSFSPSAVTGVSPSNSVSVPILYTYTDPATLCANTFSRSIMVHDRPTAVDDDDIDRIQPGNVPVDETIIQLCQGTTATFSFTANVAGYNYRWYEGTVSPGNLKGTAATFKPPVNTATPDDYPFVVTREKNGCESVTDNLPVTVKVIALPPAPVPNFPDANRQYCVSVVNSVEPTHLGVPGTNLTWYNGLGAVIAGITDDNLPTPTQLSIETTAAKVYNFSISQTETVNFCEGPKTPITVTIKALPVVSISAAPGIDASKICTTSGVVRFIATDLSDPGTPAANGDWSVNTLAGTLNDFPSLGEVDLNPLAATPDTYTLEYDYQNSAGCSNLGSISLTVLPKLTPSIDIADACEGSPSIITNTTTPIGAVHSASWVFGDGSELVRDTVTENIDPAVHEGKTTGTYLNPHHVFPNTGTFQVKGILTTAEGCNYVIPEKPATISEMPVAKFTTVNVCAGIATTFTASADIAIETYEWNFAKNGLLLGSTPTTVSTAVPIIPFTYTNTGKDIVRLIASTSVGCKDTVEKPVYIVPTYTPITPSASYSQDFTLAGGWIAGGTNPSWQLGIPTAAPAPLTGNAWDTNPTGSNNAGENSWVLSGCFNLAGVTKPVISLDIWSDVPTGVDGAVLQYNITGNIEDNVPPIAPDPPDPDGDWKVVGEVGVGINWYNENGISNSPGSQTTVSAGWTGSYAQWKKAIFKLDDIRSALALEGDLNKPVVFRIAFSSLQPRGEGFTFDNVFIGERSRIVLLENFTNSSVNTQVHNNNNYKDFGTAAELVKIQYHTAFPGDDPINDLNQQMNNSRAAFYGITESPTVRVDGDFRNSAGGVAPWLNALYADRVLTPSDIKLTATATKVGKEVRINTTIENTTNQSLPLAGAHVFTAIVQKSVVNTAMLGNSGNTEFAYVAMGMLPTAAGITIPSDLLPGEPFPVPEIIWNDANGGDAIVVFVQSIDGNKNVYQAILLDSPPVPELITGTEDPEYASHINLYPNPANHEMNIELPDAVNKPTPVALFDAFGRTVYQATFKAGQQTMKVSTSTLADGIYMMQIITPQGGKAVRKVMVKH